MECISYERKGIDNKTAMDDLFDIDRAKLLDYGITLTPAVVINGQPYRGELDGESIFRQICQTYQVDEAPDVCKEGYDLEPELGKLSDFVEPRGHSF